MRRDWRAELLVQAIAWSAAKTAALVIDDTAMPKKGSFGWCRSTICLVSRQDGQLPNMGVADACAGEVPVMVALRLRSESWTSNPVRSEACGRSSRAPRSADQARDCLGGDRPRHRLRCAFRLCACRFRYGSSGPFREASSERGLLGRWVCRGARTSIRRHCPELPIAKTGSRSTTS